MTKVSFVIPCYRSEHTVTAVAAEIEKTMAALPQYDWELVLVNDCSPDGTFGVLRGLAEKDARITAVDLAKNFGQHAALMCGMRHTDGDVVGCLDDDGQTPVGRVFDFLEELEKGYDVVCARYVRRDQPSGFRRLGSVLNRAMSDWLIEKPKGTYMAAVFMARRFVTDEMIRYRQPYSYISGLILRITKNVGNLDVEQRGRASGQSGYTLKKLLALWMNGFTAFSIKPLRLCARAGALFAALSFLAGLVTLLAKLLAPGVAVLGFVILEALFFTCGLQLLFLGLVGEYIGRIYMCINQSPQYVVKELVRYEGEKE